LPHRREAVHHGRGRLLARRSGADRLAGDRGGQRGPVRRLGGRSMAVTTLAAIVARFDGDAALQAAFAGSGGLWVGGVPEDRLALPQIVVEGFHERPEWDLEAAVIQDEGDWTLALFAAGLD